MKESNGYAANLIVGRSKDLVRFVSKSFFDNLGNKVSYDDSSLDINY